MYFTLTVANTLKKTFHQRLGGRSWVGSETTSSSQRDAADFLAINFLKIIQSPAFADTFTNSFTSKIHKNNAFVDFGWKNMVHAVHNFISMVCPAQFSHRIFGDLADLDRIWPGSDTHICRRDKRKDQRGERFTVELIWGTLEFSNTTILSNIWILECRKKARMRMSERQAQWFITVTAGLEAGDQEKEASGQLRSSHPLSFGAPTLWRSRK